METFRALCARPPTDFRILLGYAGWGPAQLEREMMAGAWLTCEVTSSLVFETPLEELWDKAVRGLGVNPSMLVHGGGMH
jgi:putative transcriptional regulator